MCLRRLDVKSIFSQFRLVQTDRRKARTDAVEDKQFVDLHIGKERIKRKFLHYQPNGFGVLAIHGNPALRAVGTDGVGFHNAFLDELVDEHAVTRNKDYKVISENHRQLKRNHELGHIQGL